MSGRYAPWLQITVLTAAASLRFAAPACAADPVGVVPPYSESRVMLMLSRPIGAGATTFSIRLERATTGSSDAMLRNFAPLRVRAILELQLTRGAAPRMQFGPKVTWDLGDGRLEPTSLVRVAWPVAISR